MARKSLSRRQALLLGMAGIGALAGCSGDDEGNGNGGDNGGDSAPAGDDTATEQTPTETSKEQLVSKAREEGKVQAAYVATGYDKVWSKWKEQYPKVKLNRWRAASGDWATRLISASKASNSEFDVAGTQAPATYYQVIQSNVFESYVPPYVRENDLAESRMRSDNRAGVVAVNEALTFLYSKSTVDNPPTTLDELFTDRWKGKCAVDVRDSQLLLALQSVHDKSRAEEIVKNLADIATWRESHFTAAKEIAKEGGPEIGITFRKYPQYVGQEKLGETIIEGFPKTGREEYYSLVAGGKNPNAGKLNLNFMHKNAEFISEIIDAYHVPEDKDSLDNIWWWTINEAKDINLDELDSRWKNLTGLA